VRHRPIPIMLLTDDLEMALGGGGEEAVLEREPWVLIAITLDPPLSMPVLFAPFLGAVLAPKSERYGDGWLRGVLARDHDRPAALAASGLPQAPSAEPLPEPAAVATTRHHGRDTARHERTADHPHVPATRCVDPRRGARPSRQR